MDKDLRQQAIALYDRFTHEGMERRTFMSRMVALAGSVAAGDKLDAGVVYYGPAPDPSEAAKVQAPLAIHLAGLDERVNRTAFPWITALRQAGKTVRFYLYEGVNHAFNNDTSAERYNKAAADLAWRRTLAFFRRYLR